MRNNGVRRGVAKDAEVTRRRLFEVSLRYFFVICVSAVTLLSAGVDVPVTIEETADVARAAEPVTFGVPMPSGSLKDVSSLRLYSPERKPVPAAFRVVNRWPDGSVQWVHTDFCADAAPRMKGVYRLRTSAEPNPAPAAALQVDADPNGDVTVSTGPLTFTVHKTGALLDGPGMRGADLVLRSDERFYKASQWQANELIIEEQSPIKVVLKRTGAHGWADGKDKALDYTVRIVAWAGRPYIRLIYSFVNRQGKAMSDFVRLDGLWLEGKLEKKADPVRIDQLKAEPRRPGWFEAGGIGVGMRWFWQLYPKGFEVTPDGLLKVALFPDSARPQNIYMGVAKTHEVTLSFGGGNLAAQIEEPLYAVASPKWYTRETKALGRLVESSPEAIREEYWPLVKKYDEWLVKSRDAVLAKRDRGFEFRGEHHDEYGMLNFGDAMHKLITNPSRVDYGVHWDTEYYDFPHAMFLHFFRTGDMKSFRAAIEAAAHHADVDTVHAEINPTMVGAPRTGPGLNHWVRYSNGQWASGGWAFYKNEGIFDRWLLTGDLWSRDVARMSAEHGVMANALDIDNNTRSIGHGLFAMLKAYEVFGDKKYLSRANWIVDSVHAWQDGDTHMLRVLNPRVQWDPQFKGGYSHQSWMYGIALEGMAQTHQVTKRPEMPAYMKRAADWIFNNPKEWIAGERRFVRYENLAVMLTPGLAYISETTGDRRYWDVAFENFKRQTEAQNATDHLKLFAQYFRNSQRFLWYLSVEGPAFNK